jgi:hypothetical protein
VDEIPLPDKPVAGLFHEDVMRITQVLARARWPSQKWQLLAHVVQDPALCARTDPRTIQQLWALPAGQYSGLGQVLAGAARTTRGHPDRAGAQSHPRPRAGQSPRCW